MKEVIFEWDDEKEKINIRKHGISFSTAAFVFNDPNRLEYFDVNHSDFEDRYATIGMVGKVLTVIYTIRGERYRIISARIATKAERSAYYGN
ncbi:BrnT family toxin [Pseudobutyrivibrio sp.]|uniref:BrnT family toxin n=1 Tax=Pseudobutyrivibrio sp. TaxID=2014367 RepID=UPI001DF9F11E|nr:BrnT family toxin [Pseudobutyrivibrio sp.]MBE5910645.1 BrnT family toxin [Pseudobutyrivibrio sp.]